MNTATISTTSLLADMLVKATGHGEGPSKARVVRHRRELVPLIGHLVRTGQAYFHQILLLRQPDHHLYTDTAGSWGCGALAQPHWLQVLWSNQTPLTSMAMKELLPIVLAVAVCFMERAPHLPPLRQHSRSVTNQLPMCM